MKKLCQKILIPIFCLLFLSFILFNIDNITNWTINIIHKEPTVTIQPQNSYAKQEDYLFVQRTDDYTPLSKQDLKNIFYTIVDNGWKKFTFYCPSEYTNCLNDVKELSQDQDLLTHLNNFVHPYNGFSNVKTVISEAGDVTVSIEYFYSQEEIDRINNKVDEIYTSIITNDMDLETKILTIHDYIINNTKYDIERNNNGTSEYHSYTAYGPLIEGYATCNGYTDAMALFLTKMNVPNFKVAMTPENKSDEEGHVWNAVYLNDTWLHLDLTWDDPVSTDGKDYLQHKYFLITTSQLKEIDSSGEVIVTEHNFKQNIYLELKES